MGPLGPLFSLLAATAKEVPFSLGLVYWFYIEGLGFALVLLYFYHVLVRGGSPYSKTVSDLIDRAIIDDFFNKHIPGAFVFTYTRLFSGFETGVVDEGYNRRVVDGVLGAGRRFGRIQTGRINHYLIAFAAGAVFLIFLLFGMMQW
jgi:NADH:ubiquinone oxidoreductase subunit 5 (subunit L)/multisubunit Na+/H+ antiporter MnhA subunit